MLKQLLISFVLTAFTYAVTLDLGLKQLKGQESYTVWDQQNRLRASLYFPFEATLIYLRTEHTVSNYTFSLSLEYPLFNQHTVGEDLDWKESALTYASQSVNILNNYYKIDLDLNYRLKQNISLSLFLCRQRFEHTWENLSQTNYIDNSQITVDGEVLTYEVSRNLIGFRLPLTYIWTKTQLQITPEISYAYNDTKDTHLLRNFYVLHTTKGLNYAFTARYIYAFTKKTQLSLTYAYESFQTTQADMYYYYKNYSQAYKSLPAIFETFSHSLSLGLLYRF